MTLRAVWAVEQPNQGKQPIVVGLETFNPGPENAPRRRLGNRPTKGGPSPLQQLRDSGRKLAARQRQVETCVPCRAKRLQINMRGKSDQARVRRSRSNFPINVRRRESRIR